MMQDIGMEVVDDKYIGIQHVGDGRTVASTADEDDAVLVHNLICELDEAAHVGGCRALSSKEKHFSVARSNVHGCAICDISTP